MFVIILFIHCMDLRTYLLPWKLIVLFSKITPTHPHPQKHPHPNTPQHTHLNTHTPPTHPHTHPYPDTHTPLHTPQPPPHTHIHTPHTHTPIQTHPLPSSHAHKPPLHTHPTSIPFLLNSRLPKGVDFSLPAEKPKLYNQTPAANCGIILSGHFREKSYHPTLG